MAPLHSIHDVQLCLLECMSTAGRRFFFAPPSKRFWVNALRISASAATRLAKTNFEQAKSFPSEDYESRGSGRNSGQRPIRIRSGKAGDQKDLSRFAMR